MKKLLNLIVLTFIIVILSSCSKQETNNKMNGSIPNLIIHTKNGNDITSKENYLDADLRVENANGFSLTIDNMRIRGRGNSTWGYPKKPYRLKFDKDISLLGMKPATDYVLLAEHNDKSLMRNYAAHYLSSYLKLPHSLEANYVNVYLNGNYNGLYLLTEQVAVSKNRLNIDVSEDIDGGFLIELEREFERANSEGIENRDWFRMQNPNPNDRNNEGDPTLYQELYYVVKSPKLKEYDEVAQLNKINYYKNYFKDFEDSVKTNKYSDYIDVDNFIDYFILTELFKQVDIGYSSVFITKDKNEKMQMGPIWDFDISSGNGNYYAYGPKGFWADYNPWFGILIKNKGFEIKYIERFNEVIDLYFEKLISELMDTREIIQTAANRNFDKWGMHLDDGFNPNPIEMLSINNHKEQTDYLINYLIARKDWLLETLNNEGYFGYLGENDEGWS